MDSRSQLQRWEQNLQDRNDLRQEEEQKHPWKKLDHSRKLSFENNAIESQYLYLPQDFAQVFWTKQPEP